MIMARIKLLTTQFEIKCHLKKIKTQNPAAFAIAAPAVSK